MTEQKKSEEKEDDDFVTRVGPLEIDWPRSLGYFAGIGLAVGFELIAPPLGLFIAAVPFLKLLKRENAPLGQRMVAALLEGVAKPVGGDSEGTVRLANEDEEAPAPEDKSEKARAQAKEAPQAVN